MRLQPAIKLTHSSKAVPVHRTVPGMQGSAQVPSAELHCAAVPQFCSS